MPKQQRRKPQGQVYRLNWKAAQYGCTDRLTEDDVQYVLETYGRRCLCCGETEYLCMDHVIPLARNGPNTRDNLQPLCRWCNGRKGPTSLDFRNSSRLCTLASALAAAAQSLDVHGITDQEYDLVMTLWGAIWTRHCRILDTDA